MQQYKIEIEYSKKEVPTLKVNNLYIHSKYDPIKEAHNKVIESYKPHHLHVVIGYGLGYTIEELINYRKFDEPIIVIDPLIDDKLIEYHHQDSSRVYYVKNDNDLIISTWLSELSSYSTKIVSIIQNNYLLLFSNRIREILQLTKDTQIREIFNRSTINIFGLQWQLNCFLNMKFIGKDHSLNKLTNKYTAPIVIASGGPSLTKQIPFLKMYRSKFILICAGSTVNTLLKEDIEPDYVVSIDGGEPNANHFRGGEYKYIQLIYSPTSHHEIRSNFVQNGFLFIPYGLVTLKKYYEFNSEEENYSVILGGGSVAHYALSIAKHMTSGSIALVGQDLAYTNDMSHADGNKGAKSIEDVEQEIIEIDGWHGDKVKSDDVFKTMLDTFEKLQLNNPHINRVYNCTEGGAKIKLMDQLTFKEFLESNCNENVERININKSVTNSFNFERFYKNELKNYNEIIKILKKGIVVAKKEQGPFFSDKSLKDLSKLEKRLNVLYEAHNLDALLEPIIVENEFEFLPSVNETKLDEFKRVKNYTIKLYEDCLDRINEFIKVLNEEVGFNSESN